MTRHEELLDNYEDALFALLMDEIAETEGQKYLDENERLLNDPSAAVSELLDQKCRRIIKHSFSKNKRHEAARIAKMAVSRAAVLVLVVVALFSSAYAIFPEVRVKTINLLIEVSDVATGLSFGGGTGTVTSELPEETFFGYVFPEVPESFHVFDEGGNRRSAWIAYENDEGAIISFDVSGSETANVYVDTEDADNIENIEIHGFEGLLIEKGDVITIIWGDTDQAKYVSVMCVKINKADAINYAIAMRP